MHESRLALRPNVEAPALGRQALDDMLVHVPRQTVQDAQLLLTEVITNAIRHAGLSGEDVISIRILDSPRAIDVEVSNRGPGFDPTAAVPGTGGTGWGLLLLDRLAEDWGVREGPSGEVVVWFRLPSDEV